MKKQTAIIIFLFFLFFQVSCYKQSENIKVGILIPFMNNSRWENEGNYLKEEILKLGGEAIIKSAESNELQQLAQAEELIEQGVDVIIIVAVNVNSAAAIVRLAHESGVKVIAYDRLVRNSEPDFYISFDGEKVGELLANYALNRVPQGNYVLLNGDRADENAVIFYKGTMKVLKPHIENNEVNIVYTGYMKGWFKENAAFYTNKIIDFSNVDVDVIISQYDGLTDGVVEVLNERGLSKQVLVTGQDALINACKRIVNDEQAMTIYKPPKQLVHKCAELAYQIITKENIKDIKYTDNGKIKVPTILLDPIVVDKNNLNSTVVADGIYTMDEIVNYSNSN